MLLFFWTKLTFLAAFIYTFCVASPLLLVAVFLRPLHIPLRKLGVKNGYLPLDLLQRGFAALELLLFGVQVEVEGARNVDRNKPLLAMFSHVSNLDSFILGAHHPTDLKFVGKKSIFKIPFFGWAARGFGHIPIDRSNLENAIKSLEHAKQKATRWGRSIAISPEGTRSKTGKLQPFKKGAFHVAKQLGFPISPVVIFGAYELWPPGTICPRPGVVTIRVVPSLKVGENDTVEGLQEKVHEIMEKTLRHLPEHKHTKLTPLFCLMHVLAVVLFLSLPVWTYYRVYL